MDIVNKQAAKIQLCVAFENSTDIPAADFSPSCLVYAWLHCSQPARTGTRMENLSI